MVNDKIRVADYIAEFIYGKGVRNVYMIAGGGAMFLNDGIAKCDKLNPIFNHHEQACAMAAVGESKYTNKYAVVMPTTGCGSTNTMTGLLDAWQDNVKVVFISGQANKNQTVHNSTVSLRQAGVQEADIIALVKPITKYAVMVNEPYEIAYHLEKAFEIAASGRPGPVWIDVPLDIQNAIIETDLLTHYKASIEVSVPDKNALSTFCEYFNKSKRPIIIAGNGIQLSDAKSQFLSFVEKYKIPVVATYLAIDVMPSDHPLFIGRIGTKGDRAGNFAMQNADLVISMGSRLSVGSTGHRYDLFAREAKVIAVDIDPMEHKKEGVRIDYVVHSDIANFLHFIEPVNMWSMMPKYRRDNTIYITTTTEYGMGTDASAIVLGGKVLLNSSWIETCKKWKNMWSIYEGRSNDKKGVDLYHFMNTLNLCLPDDAVVVSDAGSAYYVVSQALKIRRKQRYITSGAQADMGFTLPASIGVCVARNGKDVIGITGDGSFQFNIQELQTVVHNRFPIKLFVWNNKGYLSIKITQKKFFEERLFGTDPQHGVSFPSTSKIAAAYGIKYFGISSHTELYYSIMEVLDTPGPVICEIFGQEYQEISPVVMAAANEQGKIVAKPLEDMYPFLDRKTFYDNMIVKPVKE